MATVTVRDRFEADIFRIEALEHRMSRAGNTIAILEKFLTRHFPKPEAKDRARAKIAELEAEQETINSQLHTVLKRYDVDYNVRGGFIVRTKDGSKSRHFKTEESK